MATKQIFVRTLTGKTMTVDVSETENVAGLKRILHEREGIPADQMRLVFAGKELNEERALSDYNISKASTVTLVLRLRGGFQIFVRTLTGKTMTLDVESTDSIDSVH